MDPVIQLLLSAVLDPTVLTMQYLLIAQRESTEILLQTIFRHAQVHVLLDSIVLSILRIHTHVLLEDMEIVMD